MDKISLSIPGWAPAVGARQKPMGPPEKANVQELNLENQKTKDQEPTAKERKEPTTNEPIAQSKKPDQLLKMPKSAAISTDSAIAAQTQINAEVAPELSSDSQPAEIPVAADITLAAEFITPMPIVVASDGWNPTVVEPANAEVAPIIPANIADISELELKVKINSQPIGQPSTFALAMDAAFSSAVDSAPIQIPLAATDATSAAPVVPTDSTPVPVPAASETDPSLENVLPATVESMKSLLSSIDPKDLPAGLREMAEKFIANNIFDQPVFNQLVEIASSDRPSVKELTLMIEQATGQVPVGNTYEELVAWYEKYMANLNSGVPAASENTPSSTVTVKPNPLAADTVASAVQGPKPKQILAPASENANELPDELKVDIKSINVQTTKEPQTIRMMPKDLLTKPFGLKFEEPVSADQAPALDEDDLASLNAIQSVQGPKPKIEVAGPAPKELIPDVREKVLSQIADRIEYLAAAKPRQGVTILLEPRELGSVMLVVKGSGNEVEAQVFAQNETVRQTLEQHQKQLIQQLENKGINLMSLNVGDGSVMQQNSAFADTQSRQAQAQAQRTMANYNNSSDADNAVSIESIRAMTRKSTGVDLWT